MFNTAQIPECITRAVPTEAGLPVPVAKDVAFHLTDWMPDRRIRATRTSLQTFARATNTGKSPAEEKPCTEVSAGRPELTLRFISKGIIYVQLEGDPAVERGEAAACPS